jgi:hypothetical protein
MEAYRITGLTREVRRSLPPGFIESITDEIVRRIGSGYKAISFAPHGVAARWAGTGGEVLHETVKTINEIKAFMTSSYPKTEDGFDAWADTIADPRQFYQTLGDPVILRAWVLIDPIKSKQIVRKLNRSIEEVGLETAWLHWNHTHTK